MDKRSKHAHERTEPSPSLLFDAQSFCSGFRMSAFPTPVVSAKHWRGQGTVLVVDDEFAVRHTAARLISHLGFAVREADSGSAALAYFHAGGTADLVLVDQSMPGMDGSATIAELLKLRPTLRIVIFSGFGEEFARRRFPSRSTVRFLQKPFSLDMLRNTLRATFNESGDQA